MRWETDRKAAIYSIRRPRCRPRPPRSIDYADRPRLCATVSPLKSRQKKVKKKRFRQSGSSSKKRDFVLIATRSLRWLRFLNSLVDLVLSLPRIGPYLRPRCSPVSSPLADGKEEGKYIHQKYLDIPISSSLAAWLPACLPLVGHAGLSI